MEPCSEAFTNPLASWQLGNLTGSLDTFLTFVTFHLFGQPKAGPMDTFWLIGPSGDTGEYACLASVMIQGLFTGLSNFSI